MNHRRLRAGYTAAITAAAIMVSPVSIAWSETAPRPSVNLFGMTGLIDMPTAETQPDGQVTFSYSQFGETTRRNFSFQILPRLSGSVRYSTINNWGRPDNPSYDLFDRSFDLQFQIMEEGAWAPALAIGLRDLLGTGVYSSEYIVATKTITPDVTVTAGLGWGRLGTVGGFENPLCSVSSSACDRDYDFGQGGDLAIDAWFRGEEVAFFGGVEWRTPVEGLTLKAEYSSDSYAREQPRGRRQDWSVQGFDRKSPFNFGAEYRLSEGVTLGGYYMYGSEFGFNIALSGNPWRPPVPQNIGAGPAPVNARPGDASRATGWAENADARAQLTAAIGEVLNSEGITLEQIRISGDAVDVFIVNRRIMQMPKAIGRTARILAVGMPPSVETFRITPVESGLPTTTVEIRRSDLEAQVDRPDAGLASWQTARLSGAAPALEGENTWIRDVYPLTSWSIAPVPSIQIFAGEIGFRPQITAEARGRVQVSSKLSFSGAIRQPVLGTFDDPGVASGRALPPVRRESGRYYSGSDPMLMRATGDYFFKINEDVYARASAGYLERQFVGVSGEALWKPVAQNWGIGLEVNYVRRRDPMEFVSLDDYEIATGHASLYWDTGFAGIEAQVDAGRYLAGDWGATFSLRRRFESGWSVGAFVTRTDVSAEDFGEGSFDKGIEVSIPLRWSTPFETRQVMDVNLRSLSSDGGARLNVSDRLYPTVRDLDRNRMEQNWGAFWQ